MNTTQTFRGTAELPAFAASRKEVEWMASLRHRAYERFSTMDWPTTREEEWRRSDISSYDFEAYGYGSSAVSALSAASATVPAGYSGTMKFRGAECVEITLKPELAARGVLFLPLNLLLAADRHAIVSEAAIAALKQALTAAVDGIDNRICAWHYAAMSHGAYLYVPEFVEINEPFRIDYTENGDSTLSAPETVVHLEKGARATAVQSISGQEEGELLFNEGSDLIVRDAASLSFLSVQNLNLDCSVFSNGNSRVDRDSSFEHFVAVFGGMFAKDRFDCTLDGPGSDVRLNGIYFGHKDQHFDVRTVQHHNAPHATSRTYYKGAVKDESHAVYQGLIQVAHKAIRTDAFLEDKNLILNDGARADSIPSLQINTDDVKCSHGSTTGRLDENQLHYLMARGYDRAEAEELLVEGFFGDLIDHGPEVMREELRAVIMERLLEKSEA
ncbi:MAG TPA: Fe-S cluster assembly protein SufD [Spirochaetia bacterium]|nr:Fe-S cluster assembly protein SufD [Spirochaetia bacterium]